MTPCEKLGYKVGDRFIVLSTDLCGEHVCLEHDDGTELPMFITEEDCENVYLHLGRVKLVDGEGWIKNDSEKPEYLPEFIDIKWKSGNVSLGVVIERLCWEVSGDVAVINYWRPHVAKSSCKVDEDTLAQPDTIAPADNQDASKRNTGRFSITQMYTLRNVLGEEILTTDKDGLEELNNLIGELLYDQENHPL